MRMWIRVGLRRGSRSKTAQLNHIHRTAVAGLLNAGANLRQLAAPAPGPGLSIRYFFPNVAPFRIGAAIAQAQGTRAVLFPPAGRAWADAIAQRLSKGLHSPNYNIPPIRLILEPRASDEIEAVMIGIAEADIFSPAQMSARFGQLENPPRWIPHVTAAAFQAIEPAREDPLVGGRITCIGRAEGCKLSRIHK